MTNIVATMASQLSDIEEYDTDELLDAEVDGSVDQLLVRKFMFTPKGVMSKMVSRASIAQWNLCIGRMLLFIYVKHVFIVACTGFI